MNFFSRYFQAKNPRDQLFGLPLMPEGEQVKGRIRNAIRENTKVTQTALEEFDPQVAIKKLSQKEEGYWLKNGEARAIALFHAAAEHVPAYKKFLKEHNIESHKVKTIEDFKKIPYIDKENYLRKYPLEELCWYGEVAANQMISVSSGSSGQPFFWPRAQMLDAETALEHELSLSTAFEMDRNSTLFIVCFAMGMYVAGPITLSSVMHMGRKGYPVTVVTPGYAPEDVLKVIPDLAPKYDQVVLAGYPPYIKEIIDKGREAGIDWGSTKLRFLLAGEGFNESWRSYVAELAEGKSPLKDFINFYGTADAAVVAHETAASIVIRRRIAEDIAARRRLFDEERLPSFLQFYPEHKYFEEIDNELIFTTSGGIPLVRYNIHDSGGVLTRKEVEEQIPELKEYFQELEVEGKLWNLPFLYVFGKSDQTAILYGANVYPENVKRALEEEELRDKFTGRFIMYTDLDENKDQRLVVEVECKESTSVTEGLQEKVQEQVLKTLLYENSEYHVVNNAIGERTIPLITLLKYKDKKLESGHVKHAWKKKE